ncbi:probable amidase At4g34880 isoform X1 [Populus trichocarpa]|uniref:probable amidase At4g34880 isoform X1 n=1 Tax=Populus trichocarpa TaxID=3694 RepID=UPI00227928BE|nr:probable amidase At4g34880 isoform X1 [Populus trichocarpa]
MVTKKPLSSSLFSSLIFFLLAISCHAFSIREASISDLQLAFKQKKLTSRQLVEFYVGEIHGLNSVLKGVIEINPDALYQADRADYERRVRAPGALVGLHGIPILLKDNIATKDKLNTTAGSFALLRSVVPRDAGVVAKLRKSGAIILGKASLSEWAAFRSLNAPNGFCGRSGQGKNPYVLSATPCGSSSGSGISVAANLAAVSLGTETDGSIICPSSYNSVVGIKPTVGLTSRAGVIPITPRQDTVGPMCRTVSDAVYVLDAIVGFDSNDAATREAAKYIPNGGYRQFLNPLGLKGKRLGILRTPFYNSGNDKGSRRHQTFEHHFQTLRRQGAVLVDHLQISDVDTITAGQNGELLATLLEFKPALNEYLEQLVASPVRSLAAVIAFNKKFSRLEKTKEYGQELFKKAEFLSRNITNIDATLKKLVSTFSKLSKNGLEKLIKTNKLDAVVAPDFSYVLSFVLAIGQYPGISVPAGYDSDGVPFGICFGGPKGSEPKLIEIAYGFETATKVRRPPAFKP